MPILCTVGSITVLRPRIPFAHHRSRQLTVATIKRDCVFVEARGNAIKSSDDIANVLYVTQKQMSLIRLRCLRQQRTCLFYVFYHVSFLIPPACVPGTLNRSRGHQRSIVWDLVAWSHPYSARMLMTSRPCTRGSLCQDPGFSHPMAKIVGSPSRAARPV